MKNATFVSVLLTLLIASLFFAVSAGPALTSQGSQIQANSFTASQGIQPYMTMNTNITWSTFNNGWNALEYNNGTANLTLNTGFSELYNNSIVINPMDMISSAMQGKVDNVSLVKSITNNTTTLSNGAIRTQGNNGVNYIYLQTNISKQGQNGEGTIIPNDCIPVSKLPSNNPSYDILSFMGYFSAPNITGLQAEIGIINGTQIQNPSFAILPNNAFFVSISLKSLQNQAKGYNITGKNAMTFLGIEPKITYPSGISSSATPTLYISGISMTENYMSIGSYVNKTGTHIVSNSTNVKALNTFSPDFSWTTITNNGYSVATSQPLLNTTISQTAISNGSYIEEVQTQGQFKLPSAPDLTYGSANITEQLNVSSIQVLVLDINGLSYLSTISGKNGTINLIGSVNPTSSTSFLEIVEYTSSQWNSISGPPGFFSVAGVEYYFDEIVLGLTALLGMGGLAAHRKAAQLRRVK